MLKARTVSVRVGSKALIEDVSLEMPPGEVVAVVGPNGAGKSTLMKTLCGDLQPSAGEVWMEDRPLSAWAPLERAQVRAVLPQQSTLTFPFTVLEVVLMGRVPHVKSAEGPRDYEIARLSLKMAGMQQFEDRLYPTLSGGEQQRVQLARVLAQVWETPPSGSRYLLLDEPTSNLDLAHQHATLDIARRFAGEGVGVLTILHDLNLAAQYADRIVILKEARQLASGSPQAVLTPDLIQDAFGMPISVMSHPYLNCPLVVPVPGHCRVSRTQGKAV